MAGILSQYRDCTERPVAFASRQLNQHEQRYSFTEVVFGTDLGSGTFLNLLIWP